MELKLVAAVDYLSSLYESPKCRLLVVRRPFLIVNWMWPQRVSFRAVSKGMGISDGYSLADLGLTFKTHELMDLSMIDDRIAMTENDDIASTSPPIDTGPTTNNNSNTNTNTNSNSASMSQGGNAIKFTEDDLLG